MKYNLEDIKLRKVAEGKSNAGALFIQATVVNPDDEYEGLGQMTTFNERLVKKFSELLVPSLPGPLDQFGRQTWLPSQLKDASKPIPENLLVFTHGQFEEVPSPGGVEMVRLKDGSDEPALNKKGGFYVTNKLLVLTKKTVDNETGETRYAKGWTPDEQARSIWNNLYAPLSKFNSASSAGIQLPGDPEIPLINGASAPAPAV